jgi:hypothetical protein
MNEPIAYLTPVIAFLVLFTGLLLNIVKLFEESPVIMTILRKLPYLLKLLVRFLVYGLSLIIPIFGVIWYYFYQAGISPDRLSDTKFFSAVVVLPTIGVSIYAYIWGRWIYPKLQKFPSESNSSQEPKHEVSKSKKSSNNGGKK